MASAAEHCDDTNLALVAAGGPAPSAIFTRHMHACPTCSQRYDECADVVAVAVASMEDRAYSQPPGKVWRSIADGAGAAGSQPGLVIEGMPARLRAPVAPAPEVEHGGDRNKLVLGIVAAIVAALVAAFVLVIVLAG